MDMRHSDFSQYIGATSVSKEVIKLGTDLYILAALTF
jgi:hypothetical protein